MQICKEFPPKWNTDPKEKTNHIVGKSGFGTRLQLRSRIPYKKYTDENTDNGGFYELAAGVNQSVLVFLHFWQVATASLSVWLKHFTVVNSFILFIAGKKISVTIRVL